jgi:hypothetical protein
MNRKAVSDDATRGLQESESPEPESWKNKPVHPTKGYPA